jgi:hypothetical protein
MLVVTQMGIRLSAIAGSEYGWHWRKTPFGSEAYAQALGIDVAESKRRLRTFQREARRRWSQWAAGRLQDPHELDWWTARPTLIVTRASRLPKMARRSTAGVLSIARIWIPVFPDTHAENVDWGRIAALQHEFYDLKRRTRDRHHYAESLAIWDEHHEGHEFSEIALRRGRPLSTVKSRWRVVQRDIDAFSSPDEARRLLAEHPRVPHEWDGCEKCWALAEQDQVPLGERLAGEPNWIEDLGPGIALRKRPKPHDD